MNKSSKVIAGIMFAASVGFALKAFKDIRDMKNGVVDEHELQDETEDQE